MNNKKLKNIIKEDGQALVEFAITLPVLMLILCGIIDFGWLFSNQSIIDHCSREGARYAIVNSSGYSAEEQIINYTKSLAPSYIRDALNVNVIYSNTVNPRLGDVQIKVDGNIKVLTPLASIFTHDQVVDLSSSCTMKVE